MMINQHYQFNYICCICYIIFVFFPIMNRLRKMAVFYLLFRDPSSKQKAVILTTLDSDLTSNLQ